MNTFEKPQYWLIQEHFFLEANAYLNILPNMFWSNLTHLGDASVLIPILAIFIVKKPRVWIAIFIASAMAGVFSLLGKNVFHMPRPASIIDPENFVVIGELLTKHNSLPSGHSITIFAGIVTLLIVFFPSPRSTKDYIWMLLGFLTASLVSISRVAVGAHWPIDIIVGGMLGWLAGAVGSFIYLYFFSHPKTRVNPYVNVFISFSLILLSLTTFSRIISDAFNSPIYLVSSITGISSAFFILFDQLNSADTQIANKNMVPVILPKMVNKWKKASNK